MRELDVLSQQYPGDDAFADYASCCQPKEKGVELDAVRALIPQDEQLSETLAGYLGFVVASDWVDWKVDALEGFSAKEIIASRPDGCRIVRTALMRMP